MVFFFIKCKAYLSVLKMLNLNESADEVMKNRMCLDVVTKILGMLRNKGLWAALILTI